MSDETKTERDLEPPAPVDGVGVQPAASGAHAAGARTAGSPRITNGRLDTGLKLLAQAGAAHHDGRALSAEMGADPELVADLQRLARENPEGSGPFRQKVGADLLPAAPASERAEAVSLASSAPCDTQRGLGSASARPVAASEPKTSERNADTPSAAPAANWPPYGAPEVKSDTELEIDASKLHIPRDAFVVGRAVKAAEQERQERRHALLRNVAFALFAGAVVVIGLWLVRREPAPIVAPGETAPAVPSTAQVAATAAPVVTVPAVAPTPSGAPTVTPSPPASTTEASPPAPPVKSAASARRPQAAPASAPKPPIPAPPTPQAPAGPIYD